MFTRIRVAAAALLMALALAPAPVAASDRPAPAPQTIALADPQGLCGLNAWPADKTGQYYFKATTGATFDRVIGWMTVRPQWPCEGLGMSQGWAFSAAANVQGNGIWQIGYITVSGDAGTTPYFARTKADGSGQAVLIGSPRPVLGVRYQFEVYRNSAGWLAFRIKNMSGGTIYSTSLVDQVWWDNRALDYAWWGWEVGNSESAAGLCQGCAEADLVGQYSTSYSSTVETRLDPTVYWYEPDGTLNSGTYWYQSGDDFEIVNLHTDYLD